MKYRKKPVTISAFQLGIDDFPEWFTDKIKEGIVYITPAQEDEINSLYYIKTLEGNMRVKEKDYVILGVAGELYPCREDIFYQTYEKVK